MKEYKIICSISLYLYERKKRCTKEVERESGFINMFQNSILFKNITIRLPYGTTWYNKIFENFTLKRFRKISQSNPKFLY